jgi:hypothetical protein
VIHQTFGSFLMNAGQFIERLIPFDRSCEGEAAIEPRLSPAQRSATTLPLGPDMTDLLWDLLEACWKKAPTERPKIERIVDTLDFFV